MSQSPPRAAPPGFFTATRILLAAFVRRMRARMRGQAKTTGNSVVLFVFLVVGIGAMNWALAELYLSSARQTTRLSLDSDGALAANPELESALERQQWIQERVAGAREMLDDHEQRQPDARDVYHDQTTAMLRKALDDHEAKLAGQRALVDHALDEAADELARQRGGDAATWRADLEHRIASGVVSRYDAVNAWSPIGAALLTLLVALWWLTNMLTGVDGAIDALRRRHPMWEWYATLPVRSSAAFVAEALAPALVSPGLIAAPMLFATLAAAHTGSWIAALGALPVAVPLLLAATVWAKALEVVVMLRATPRNRGPWFIAISFASSAALLVPLLAGGSLAIRTTTDTLRPLLDILPRADVLFAVGTPAGWVRAMATSLALGVAATVPAFALLRYAVARGIENGFGREKIDPNAETFAAPPGRWRFLADPLARKDLLWLRRDRSLWFLLIGPPLIATCAICWLVVLGEDVQERPSWHQLAGWLTGFGGYLMGIAGPRVLASEAAAIGLTLSWPRPLEDMLRMKIRMAFVLIGTTVAFGFAMLLWNYPKDAIGIVIVAMAWALFAYGLAEKSVTTVRTASSAGEIEPLPLLRGFLPGLGNFAFAIGVYHAQWQLAIAAIVLNAVLATALWQDFRHRLPYLLDAASEPQPAPPTVLNSVIAIVGLLELSALIALPILGANGGDGAMFAQAFAYAIASIAVFVMTVVWYARRGAGFVRLLTLDAAARIAPPVAVFAAAAVGAVLAFAAQGYLALLHALPLPALHERLTESARFLTDVPNAQFFLAVIAVGFAPWIEEFLFRGLLLRSLLTQMSAARAIVVSSALFAVLHPWPFWPMIFAVGATSALVYLRTRALLPCVALHLAYNALVVSFG
jgi:membrane protease YdiL (CAAX protease family)